MAPFSDKWSETFGEAEAAVLAEGFGAGDLCRLEAGPRLRKITGNALEGGPLEREDALYLAELPPGEIPFLLLAASAVRNRSKGRTVTYSKNVFVPLTQLCRDRCGYCTFKIEPGEGNLFMTPDEVEDVARKGAMAGCTELLFVTGDKPELVYETYREALGEIGYETPRSTSWRWERRDSATEYSPTPTWGFRPPRSSADSGGATPAWDSCSRT